MPSLAKMIGLVLACTSPAGLMAQTFPPGGQPGHRPEVPTAPSARAWPGQFNALPPGSPPTQPAAVQPAAFQSPLPSSPAQTTWTRPGPSQPAASQTAQDRGPGAVPLAPLGRGTDLSLPRAGRSGRTGQETRITGLPTVVTVGSSLAVVLGLFLLVAWGMRRAAPGSTVLLPKEVLEVLGRAPLASRQQVHLLRCGNKLLLVSATPAGVETLSEIDDPVEVDRLAGLCRQSRPDSATAVFRQVFQQFAQQRVTPGLLGQGGRDQVHLANAGIPGIDDELLEDRDV